MIDPALALAFEASWASAEVALAGGFLVGRGAGAGGRVSSARAVGAWSPEDIGAVEALHASWGQPPLFRAWRHEAPLIQTLSARGYRTQTPTCLIEAPIAALARQVPPPVTSFAVWPPLAIQRQIWNECGIGPARQAVMTRVGLPKAALLGRIRDRAAAAGFVAVAAEVAMLHALEVLPEFRRQGLGGWLVRQAAIWAAGQGASRLALAVTEENRTARAFYASLGFTETDGYVYLSRPENGRGRPL